MAYVKSLKPINLTTTNGYALVIPARQVTWIPDPALKFALIAGCVECHEDGRIAYEDDPADVVEVAPPAPVSPSAPDDQKDTAILSAVKYLYTVGKPDDFKKDNTPKLSAVERVLGFRPTAEQMQTALTQFEELGE